MASEEDKNQRKIFISYGTADCSNFAFRLAAYLEKQGYGVWIDKQELKAGPSWEDQIETAIKIHDIFISLLTPHAVRRPMGVCLDEISFARHNNKKIIPAMVINCSVPFTIYRLNYIDFIDWDKDDKFAAGIDKLLKAIEDEDFYRNMHYSMFNDLDKIDFGPEIWVKTRSFCGREWFLGDVEKWLSEDDGKMFILTGDPGTGKSSIMAKLTNTSQIGAYHFCDSRKPETRDAKTFVHSIAAQLASQIPEFNRIISEKINRYRDSEPITFMRRVIIESLNSLKLKEKILIGIDALDESLVDDRSEIVDVLSDAYWDLCKLDSLPVKIIASTRKVPIILGKFSFLKPFELEPCSRENLGDIEAFIESKVNTPIIQSELAKYKLDKMELVKTIFKLSEGSFLHVSTLLDAIASGSISINKLDEFPPGLEALYINFFERKFSNYDFYKEEVRPILEIILASREPLNEEEIASYIGKDSYKIREVLEKSSEFLKHEDGNYKVYHKYLSDWLTGVFGRSSKYRVEEIKGHQKIYEHIKSKYKLEMNSSKKATIPENPENAYNIVYKKMLYQVIISASKLNRYYYEKVDFSKAQECIKIMENARAELKRIGFDETKGEIGQIFVNPWYSSDEQVKIKQNKIRLQVEYRVARNIYQKNHEHDNYTTYISSANDFWTFCLNNGYPQEGKEVLEEIYAILDENIKNITESINYIEDYTKNLIQLGKYYFSIGYHEKFEECYRRAFDSIMMYKNSIPNLIDSRTAKKIPGAFHLLGDDYEKVGRLIDAEMCYLMELESCEALLLKYPGNEDISVSYGLSLGDLAVIKEKQNDDAQAAGYYKECIEVFENLHTNIHSKGRHVGNLANVYKYYAEWLDWKMDEEAKWYFIKALDLVNQSSEAYSGDLKTYIDDLYYFSTKLINYIASGRGDDYEDVVYFILDILNKSREYKEAHTASIILDRLEIYSSLAEFLKDMDNVDVYEHCINCIIEDENELSELEHHDVKYVINKAIKYIELGESFFNLSRFEKSRMYFENAITELEKNLENNYTKECTECLSRSYHGYAKNLKFAGDFDMANLYYDRALEVVWNKG